MADIDNFLKIMVEQDASDLYLTVGAVPTIKTHGKLKAIADERLSNQTIHDLVTSILTPEQKKDFEREHELNIALSHHEIGRFRVNIFQQRSSWAIVIRHIKLTIPTIEELGLPEVVKELIMKKRGLILFVGATGVGKSTSLAALIEYRNTHSADHIITIEDPIEFIHQHKKSIVDQREIGLDTKNYRVALKNTLRQAPDVILIGEIRTAETMQHAITFSETGHLCLATLHANNTNQAMERILSLVTEEKKARLLLDLSLNLSAIISQRLVPTKDGKRVAAFEVLIATPLACELIKRGDVAGLKDLIEKSAHIGMQSFDDNLFRLYKAGTITMANALEYADSPQNLRLRVTLDEGAYNSSLLKLDTTHNNHELEAQQELLTWAKRHLKNQKTKHKQ